MISRLATFCGLAMRWRKKKIVLLDLANYVDGVQLHAHHSAIPALIAFLSLLSELIFSFYQSEIRGSLANTTSCITTLYVKFLS